MIYVVAEPHGTLQYSQEIGPGIILDTKYSQAQVLSTKCHTVLVTLPHPLNHLQITGIPDAM